MPHPSDSDPNQVPAEENRICDYEGSPYRRDFWEQADRSYEDVTERLAIRDLLPSGGKRIVEIGAGFGRLAGEYRAYDEIILLDYAYSMIADARELIEKSLKDDGGTSADLSSSGGPGKAGRPKVRFVCADLYHLPFASQSLDTCVQIRVLHHVEDIDKAFAEVSRSLNDEGHYVLEFANKRNLKAILRSGFGLRGENPFAKNPYEFIPLNWNFHPSHVREALSRAGFAKLRERAVSHFRAGIFKKRFSPASLAKLDAKIGNPLAALTLAPSQFVLSQKTGTGSKRKSTDPSPAAAGSTSSLWRCPACGNEAMTETETAVECNCGKKWPIKNGIYVFRDGAI